MANRKLRSAKKKSKKLYNDRRMSTTGDPDVRKAAILAVLEKRMTIRQSASAHGLKKSTLADMVTKVKKRRKVTIKSAEESSNHKKGDEIVTISEESSDVDNPIRYALRSRVSTTGKDEKDPDVRKAAILAVLEKKMTIRKSASAHGLKKSTLADMVSKIKKRKVTIINEESSDDNLKGDETVIIRDEDVSGHGAFHVIFTKQQENDLKEYISKALEANNGVMTWRQVKTMAFDFAKALGTTLNHQMPKSWEVREAAGEEWLKGFRRRHPDIVLGHKPKSEESSDNLKGDEIVTVKSEESSDDNLKGDETVIIRDEDVVGHGAFHVIFTKQQELDLKEYISRALKANNGVMTWRQVKTMAFDLAKALGTTLNHPMPKSWEVREAAGEEWLKGFRRRHPDIVIGHKPKADLVNSCQ